MFVNFMIKRNRGHSCVCERESVCFRVCVCACVCAKVSVCGLIVCICGFCD